MTRPSATGSGSGSTPSPPVPGRSPKATAGCRWSRAPTGGCGATRSRSSAPSSSSSSCSSRCSRRCSRRRTRYAQLLLSEMRPGSIPGAREGFPLGVDHLGRDLLSRLIYGSRQSLLIGVVSTVLGVVVGMAARRPRRGVRRLGRHRGHAVRRHHAVGARPADGHHRSRCSWAQSQYSLMIAIAVTQVPIFARLLRGSMLVQRDSDYAVAAHALGVKKSRIVLGHVLPNSLSPVIVQATLSLATAIIEAAALSFLGLGDPDLGRPEWGAMLASAQDCPVDPAAARHLPGAVHHRRRARLHAARRVAARGPRPEVPEVSRDDARAGRSAGRRCSRSTTSPSPSTGGARPRPAPSTASASPSRRARRSAWSASPAAASR